MQKYRADYSEIQPNGAVHWYTRWMGGPSLAKIGNCPIDKSALRRTVYITGEARDYFSIPACTRIRGKYIAGFVMQEGDALVFCPMNRHKDRIPDYAK
jgi:hypothetical protein